MGAPAISPRARPAARPKPRRKPPSRPRAAAPARRPAKRSRPAAPRTTTRSRAAAGGSVAMLPVTAVGGIADSGVVVGMSRSRAWIVVLGVLLGGIVAVNVVGLSLSSAGSATSTKIDDLQQQNSVMQTRIANRLSNERITRAATALGLAVPAPDAVHYLDARPADAKAAAKRLADGLIANAPPVIAPSEADLAAATATTSTDPAVVDPVVAPAAVPVDPAATAAVPAPTDPSLATTTP